MHPSSTAHPLALLCRVGFEPDLIDELRAWFAARSLVVEIHSAQEAVVRVAAVAVAPRLAELVFARDLLVVEQELSDLDVKDRVTPIGRALGLVGAFAQLVMLTPDSESTKPLAPLLTALEARLRKQATATGDDSAASVWMLSGTHALVGRPPADGGARYPGGVPRLKFPRGAPSRSTLKLDEAFQVLLTEAERSALLRPGLTAVDLGAAPGGWTYQLVMRQMRVTAIDNGRVDATLMASGLVTHLREDGFRYRPARPVDWLVCDMVEKPGRVAELVARWFASGWCHAAVFNLKLPMKKRFEAWLQALQVLRPLAAKQHIRARQLYHDREEITVAVVPTELRRALAPVGAGSARDGKRSRVEPAPTGKTRRPDSPSGKTGGKRSRAEPAPTGKARRPGSPSGKTGGKRSRAEPAPTGKARRPGSPPSKTGSRRSRTR